MRRIFTGLVFLSNALAKVTGVGNYDWGYFSFNLITGDAAKSIATNTSSQTQIAPLGAFYRDVVLPNWGFFGVFLTLAELAVGLGHRHTESTTFQCLGTAPASLPVFGCAPGGPRERPRAPCLH